MNNPIVVEDYNDSWPMYFQEIKAKIWPVVKDLAIGIEHIGSTSVPGLSAKPVIDLDIIVSKSALSKIIQRLQEAGYEHLGDLGIKDREAFRSPQGPIEHHLYVCLEGCLALRNHIMFRDYLRKNPIARDEYSSLKKDLALRFGNSKDEYTQRKTGFVLTALAMEGLEQEQLNSIHQMNMDRSIEIK